MALFMFVDILVVGNSCSARTTGVQMGKRRDGFSSWFVIVATVTIKCFDPDAGDALAVLLAQPHQSPAVRP
jgi:hypothetical protein